VFFRFIVEVVAADAKIQWPRKIRSKAEFLTELPGAFVIQVLCDQPVTAAELRVAKCPDGGAGCEVIVDYIEIRHGTCARLINGRATAENFCADAIVRVCRRGGISRAVGDERTDSGVESIIVFGGPQEIAIVSGLRCEGQRGCD